MKDLDLFDKRVVAAQQRLTTLWSQTQLPNAPENALLTVTVAEFGQALEELQVVSEELREQNLALAEAHQALEQQRQKYQQLFDFAPDGYLVTDDQGIIQEANYAAGKLLQVMPIYLLGKPLGVYIATADQRLFRNFLTFLGTDHQLGSDETATGEAALSLEIGLQPRSGPSVPVILTVGPVRDTVGQVTSVRWLLHDITKRKASEAEKERLFVQVSQQHEQLHRLTGRLAEVQEAERTRYAQELHDQVGQTLTALAINLTWLHTQLAAPGASSPLIQTRLTDSLRLVEEMMGGVRSVLTELHSPVLADYGLLAGLVAYGKQVQQRLPSLTVQVVGSEPEPRLPSGVENALYRIGQEALTNVVRHAQATLATVSLQAYAAQVRLTVTDNGRGFALAQSGTHPAAQHASWGLLIMQERAEAIGAQFQLTSHVGKGTTIRVTVAQP